MSLARTVYYSSLICGWMALVGWLVCEMLLMRGDGPSGSYLEVLVVGAVIGAMVGAGFNLVSGWTNPNVKQLARRAGIGLLAGAIGGGLGAFIGNLLYAISLPRALGFMILGVGVGIADGVYEKSPRKIRNGVIGGAVGGLIGGVLFDPLASVFASASGMSSRATAFVVLGLCVGGLIGASHVIMREAWLTVLDGYRTGRQLILGDSVTALGRADHLRLPFLGLANMNLEPEHVHIARLADGHYELTDNHSTLGTYVNHQRTARCTLRNGDVIRLGANLVRFNERERRRGASDTGAAGPAPRSAGPVTKPLPKPPSPPPSKAASADKSGAGPPAPPGQASPAPRPPAGQRGPLPPPPPPPPRKR